MKALNNKEITNKYFIFLANFTILLACTVLCWYLYLQTCQQQTRMMAEKKSEYDFIFNKREQLSNKIDSLNKFLSMLSTDQVENKTALEQTILKMKNEASNELVSLQTNNNTYVLFKKIIDNIEKAIDNKKALQQAVSEEQIQQTKLNNCIKSSQELKDRLEKKIQ